MSSPSQQAKLKERLLKSIRDAESASHLHRLSGAAYHFRRNDLLGLTHYQDVVLELERAQKKFRDADNASPPKGGAA